MRRFTHACLFVLLTTFTSQVLLAQSRVGPWQIHEGTEGIINFVTGTTEQRKAAFGAAKIPGKTDAGWKAAEVQKDGTINFNRKSLIKTCDGQVDFTYFQTIISVPNNVNVNSFTLSYDLADDGARVYFFNSKYPSGNFNEASDLIGNQDNHKVLNLRDLIVKGEDNRIVIVQYDQCPVLNRLVGVRLKLNDQEIVPSSGSGTNASATDVLGAGQTLNVNQSLISKNGQYSLILQSDGNLCVYKNKTSFVWATMTQGKGATRLVMQADGNLCLYTSANQHVWSTDTYRGGVDKTGSRCVIENDGSFVVYSSSNKIVWSSTSTGNTTTTTTTTTAVSQLPATFSLHAYSINGQRAEKGTDYWMGFNAGNAGNVKAGRILNQQTGTVMNIEKVVIDQARGIIALKVTNSPGGNQFLMVDDQKNIVLSAATSGNRHHYIVRSPEESAAANLNYVSFESVAFTGWFLRHESFMLKITQGTSAMRNNIVYRQDATWLFQHQAGQTSTSSSSNSTPDYLSAGQSLTTNQHLVSKNGQYSLVLQADGNLCVYKGNSVFIWGTMTQGRGGIRLLMQADGNLCIYNTANQYVWGTDTYSGGADKKGSRCVLENDGIFVVYSSTNKIVWSSKTSNSNALPMASLPSKFRLHAYSIHGKRVEKGSDYWMGFNSADPGSAKRGRILNQQAGTVMNIEKVIIDQGKGIIALKVTNAPNAGMFLVVNDKKEVVLSTAATGNKHHFIVRSPEETEAANLSYVSFESISNPGWFLRHEGFVLKLSEGTSAAKANIVYRQDATWLFQPVTN